MSNVHYSQEFKESAVEKLLSRGSRPIRLIVEETGVSSLSLNKWAKECGIHSGMKKEEKRPQELSPAAKLKAVIEFEKLDIEKQGEFLRREGLYSSHIATWKKEMESGLDSGNTKLDKASRAELLQLKSENKELKKDLHRKDRALAETTALLVLKKKADLIWGTGEDK